MRPGFLVVDQHVARNPVARAIAKKRIAEATRDFQTRLYLLEKGEDVAADVVAAAKVVAVALATCELRGEQDTPDYRVMRGTMGALVDISNTGNLWDERHLMAIDVGLERALDVYMRATALEVQKAHLRIEQLEAL